MRYVVLRIQGMVRAGRIWIPVSEIPKGWGLGSVGPSDRQTIYGHEWVNASAWTHTWLYEDSTQTWHRIQHDLYSGVVSFGKEL